MPCLNDSTILRFVAGWLSGAPRRRAEAEIGACASCAAVVAELMRAGASLPSVLKAAGLATPSAGGGGEEGGDEESGGAPDERYALGAVIARGGMGAVFSAFDRQLGRPVAIKCLGAHDRSLAARFAREIRVTASLQHPGVVPIYDSGVLPDGRQFYAMRHVPGASLEQVMADRRGDGERLGLIVPVLAVAEAVAFAHERGVIHRDLKPSNVLVGPFGETLVIDWGLARVGDVAEPAGAAGEGDALTTRDGAVLGTPRYMAPEQARGEPATRRSDVYALGGILYHALSGRPPVGGDEVEAVLARAACADVPPLARVAPRLPGDLVAIVARAMAPSPERRYANAGEFAADLRRFQTGQLVAAYAYSRRDLARRFARRHRASLALAALFALVLAVGGALGIGRIVGARAHAERERARADRERAGAEDLVRFLLRDLRGKLTTVGRLDVLGGVADRVEAYYQATAAGRADPTEAPLERAALYELRAAVAAGAGDGAAADAFLARGLELVGGARRGVRGREVRASLLASAASRASKGGRHERARALHLEAAALYRELATEAPAPRPAYELDFAQQLSHAATAADRLGQPFDAASDWATAAEVLEARRAADPNDLQTAGRLGHLRLTTGQSLYRRGALAEARRALEAALSLGATLVAREPQNVQFQHFLLWSNTSLADVAVAEGRPHEARPLRERAREVAGALVALEPASAAYQGALARAEADLGTAAAARSEWAAAAAHQAAARAAYERLAGRDPESREHKRWAGIAAAQLADAESALGCAERAREAWQAALAWLGPLAESGETGARLEWAYGLRGYAAFERGAGRPGAAAAAVDRALALLDATPRTPEERPTFTYYRAAVLAEAGALRAASGRRSAARAAWRQAVALLRDLAARAPLEPDWAKQLRDAEAALSLRRPQRTGARR